MAAADDGASALRFEEELARTPYSVKLWCQYIGAAGPARKARYTLYERALRLVPRSYKLWAAYINERRAAAAGRGAQHRRQRALVNVFERALVHMHKMPRIWLLYLGVLTEHGARSLTETRRAFDRALRALPVTQHHRVWELYVPWATAAGVPWQTAVRVYRRYLQLAPEARPAFVDYLEAQGRHEEAAQELAKVVAASGSRKHWMRLCKTIATKQIQSLNAEAIMRSGIARFKEDEAGRLWCTLADYYIRQGQFERARDVYEEGIAAVETVRDFGVVFDAFAAFEETVLSAEMEEDSGAEEEDDGDEDEIDPALELRLARLEHLMDRRELLLNSVLLRQNPNNVGEWHKRAKLVAADPARCIGVYAEAVKTVDPAKARPHSLWIAFAKLYEQHGDLANARSVFDMGARVAFRSGEDLAALHCERADFELRHDEYDAALAQLRDALGGARAVAVGSPVGLGAQRRAPGTPPLLLSPRLWGAYIDLHEALSGPEEVRAAYDRAIELRVATVQTVINYAAFLEDHSFHEAAFRVFEQSVTAFGWPHVFLLWQNYLDRFLARYKGAKVERARDLFEQALDGCPADKADVLFVKFAKFEEEHGGARRAMDVYDRAARTVAPEKRFKLYLLYIKKAEQIYGVTRTRELYQRAVQDLPDMEAKDMCLRFADVEKKLGEVDRARAILVHGAQFCDPKTVASYWKAWREFELEHGNEDTFREMLRVRRAVAVSFAQHNVLASGGVDDAPAAAAAAAVAAPVGGVKRAAEDGDGVAAEAAARAVAPPAVAVAPVAVGDAAEGDAGEIDLSDDDDDDEPMPPAAPARVGDVQEQAVPEAVFGDALGAMERFKAAKK